MMNRSFGSVRSELLKIPHDSTVEITSIVATAPTAASTDAQLSTSQAIYEFVTESQDMTAAPALEGTGTPITAIGSLDEARSSEYEATFVASQINISQDVDVGEGNTVGAGYVKTATGEDQAGQLATWMVRTALAHDVFDSYGVQSHIDINDTVAANASGNLAAISGKFDFNANTLTSGIAHAGLFIVDGAEGAVCSGDCDVLWAHIESGVPDNQVSSVIRLSTGSTVNAGLRVSPTNMTNFIDFDAAAGCVSVDTGSPGANTTHKIKIVINGTAGYIPVYTDF